MAKQIVHEPDSIPAVMTGNQSQRGGALLKRRCVIPADVYYEWQARPAPGALELLGGDVDATGGARRRRSAAKLPWAVHRLDGRPMHLAGLWAVWRDPRSCCPRW